MSPSKEAGDAASGQGSNETPATIKPTGTTTFRADAPVFKPASPPKRNPWTNFAPRTITQISSELPSEALPSPRPQDEHDARVNKRSSTSEDARSDSHRRGPRRGSIGSKSEEYPPVSRFDWAKDTLEYPSKAASASSADECYHQEGVTHTPKSTNCWFSSSNPFAKRTKVKATLEPTKIRLPDSPLPSVLETDRVINRPESDIISIKPKRTAPGSPLKKEICVAEAGLDESERPGSPPTSESPSKKSREEESAKPSRPPSRDSVHSLTSADTARRTARSASTSSEDSRRRMAATAAATAAAAAADSETR